ncbi:D-ribose pyranase [Dactylosporangium sp. NPDC000244]|uniref:D-ribose pyranase n=1 Tax=Dactylosporangium sp. NPDC000244 TaxID=3154365 RepID=UPI0033193674
MRRTGLWHPRLLAVVAAMGHGDLLVVADPGLPVPAGVEIIDLVVSRGEPGFLTVLRPVLGELVVEAATMAEELTDEKLAAAVREGLGDVPLELVGHEELKARTAHARAVVRTGEDTPYANIVLRAGVPF